jgi:hypothetical protein
MREESEQRGAEDSEQREAVYSEQREAVDSEQREAVDSELWTQSMRSEGTRRATEYS